MDWYSGDGDPASATGSAEPVSARAIPTPLEYPGAPHSRFWEIEDARVDIGGYPPDSAHFATMLLVDLVYSHGDDWFMFPVAGRSGSIVTIRSLEVVDSFGRHYSSEARLADNSPLYPGLHPPADFSLFLCKGLTPDSLVLWPMAEAPLESAPLERVQFGTDEQSNLLWALERVIDSREVQRVAAEADAGHPAYPAPASAGDTTRTKNYFYVPASGAESRWHPYKLEWEEDGELAFVQWGLADYSLQHPRPMPHAYAEVLKAGTPESPERHRIAAAAMAAGGMEMERRWQLARDVGGRPVLWAQRQRRALRTPPARNLRFDLMVEVAPVT